MERRQQLEHDEGYVSETDSDSGIFDMDEFIDDDSDDNDHNDWEGIVENLDSRRINGQTEVCVTYVCYSTEQNGAIYFCYECFTEMNDEMINRYAIVIHETRRRDEIDNSAILCSRCHSSPYQIIQCAVCPICEE